MEEKYFSHLNVDSLWSQSLGALHRAKLMRCSRAALGLSAQG